MATLLPPDISTQGPAIDHLLLVLHLFMGTIFLGWGGYFLYCLFRFRAKSQGPVERSVKPFSLPKYLELVIFGFELFLLVFLAGPLWAKIRQDFPSEKTAIVIHLIAEQYAWNVQYPGPDGLFGPISPAKITPLNPLGLDRDALGAGDDLVSVNEMHIPVHRPVVVYLSSKDVIHSFFLPVMRVKQDIIPGIGARVWFEATQTGSYEIACAQLCGNGHFRMRGRFIVDTEADFSAWLKSKEPKRNVE